MKNIETFRAACRFTAELWWDKMQEAMRIQSTNITIDIELAGEWFVHHLTNIMMDKVYCLEKYMAQPNITLSVDYVPCEWLDQAAQKAGIKGSWGVFPYKAVTWTQYKMGVGIEVSHAFGYNAPKTTIMIEFPEIKLRRVLMGVDNSAREKCYEAKRDIDKKYMHRTIDLQFDPHLTNRYVTDEFLIDWHAEYTPDNKRFLPLGQFTEYLNDWKRNRTNRLKHFMSRR